MRYKPLLWIGVAIGAIAIGLYVRYRVNANADAAEFNEQLRLARSEGIPVTAAEYAAQVLPAKPEENAGSLYRRLKFRSIVTPVKFGSKSPPSIDDVYIALQNSPSQQNIESAESILAAAQSQLQLVDQAAKRPRCWFDRNWSDGVATLFPEYAEMKSASKYVALRGSVAAARRQPDAALKDFKDIVQMARQSDEEGSDIGCMVSDAIFSIGVRAVATWSMWEPGEARYRKALDSAIAEWRKPNLRRESRGELIGVLSVIDLSATKEGRTKLGLKDDDLPIGPNPFEFLLSQPKARIAIVKAERDAWAALSLPEDQMEAARDKAMQRRTFALLA
ncbi:MAG TPA: hypothetical protein VKT78_13175, partial [Fimbriimonadaceae bacterium]|nr:hypothetical protein [Fimbriimonadaceae bacterium]